jgi:hypothetical protein
MDYPGHVIKMGETDSALVDAVAKGLKKLGYPPPQGDFALQPGKFDAPFKSLVKLFQSQHVDALGRPLKADGEIGPITWGAIFNVREVGSPTPTGKKLRDKALAVALTQDGVREKPLGSNKGKEVEAYLKSTGLGGGYFWCMAFVYWCFREAAAGGDNRFPKTASCIDAWNKAKDFRITKAQAKQKPSLVVPGSVFILDYGGGAGHTGFVLSSANGALRTIEGNTNNDGSNNGIGVFQLNRRNIMDSNLKGFIIVP